MFNSIHRLARHNCGGSANYTGWAKKTANGVYGNNFVNSQ